jgi:hypothetical protein
MAGAPVGSTRPDEARLSRSFDGFDERACSINASERTPAERTRIMPSARPATAFTRPQVGRNALVYAAQPAVERRSARVGLAPVGVI